MRPLVEAMVQKDPAKRPTMNAVVDHFALIQSSLSTFKLRCRVSDKDEWAIVCVVREVIHWSRQLYQIAHGIPPLGKVDRNLIEDESSDSDSDSDTDADTDTDTESDKDLNSVLKLGP